MCRLDDKKVYQVLVKVFDGEWTSQLRRLGTGEAVMASTRSTPEAPAQSPKHLIFPSSHFLRTVTLFTSHIAPSLAIASALP